MDEPPDDEGQAAPCHSPPRNIVTTRSTTVRFGSAPRAAERDEEVVAEPRRQGHVPAPPEVGDVLRLEGRVEVLREAEPEQPGEADRHVRVAREVEVELQRVADRRRPGPPGGRDAS